MRYRTKCFIQKWKDRIHIVIEWGCIKWIYLITFISSNGTCNNEIKIYTLLYKYSYDKENNTFTYCNYHLLTHYNQYYRKVIYVLSECIFYNNTNYSRLNYDEFEIFYSFYYI